jgi:hypothetical protein
MAFVSSLPFLNGGEQKLPGRDQGRVRLTDFPLQGMLPDGRARLFFWIRAYPVAVGTFFTIEQQRMAVRAKNGIKW